MKKELLFNFTSTNQNTLIKWLNIKANIFSIFKNRLHDYWSTSYDFEMLLDLEQCNSACPGAKYKPIVDDDLAHRVMMPHVDPMENKWEHHHLQLCDIPSPEDFECFLDQLLKFQNSPEARFKMSQKPSILFSQELMKGFIKQGSPVKLHPVDLTSDYLSESDYRAAAKQYREYYSQNKQALALQYDELTNEITRQINDATWADEVAEIALELLTTFLYTAFLAAIYSFLRTTFHVKNYQQGKVEWGLYALTLMLIAMKGQTYHPFFAALTMLSLLKLESSTLKLIKLGDKSSQLSSIVIASLVSIAESYTFTPYSALKLLLNFMVGLITAVATSIVIGNMTHSFWKPQKTLEPKVTELLESDQIATKKTT